MIIIDVILFAGCAAAIAVPLTLYLLGRKKRPAPAGTTDEEKTDNGA